MKTLVWLVAFGISSLAQAELRPEKVYLADLKKTRSYVKDGLITGGDQAINEFVIKDIRRASNSDFERVVIDLEGNRNGEPVAIARPPYYQVAVTPDEKRLVFTLFGKPNLLLNAKKVVAAFNKSEVVNRIELYPLLDDTSWTFAFNIKKERGVEVFELSKPTRIIMDIRMDGSKSAPIEHRWPPKSVAMKKEMKKKETPTKTDKLN